MTIQLSMNGGIVAEVSRRGSEWIEQIDGQTVPVSMAVLLELLTTSAELDGTPTVITASKRFREIEFIYSPDKIGKIQAVLAALDALY